MPRSRRSNVSDGDWFDDQISVNQSERFRLTDWSKLTPPGLSRSSQELSPYIGSKQTKHRFHWRTRGHHPRQPRPIIIFRRQSNQPHPVRIGIIEATESSIYPRGVSNWTADPFGGTPIGQSRPVSVDQSASTDQPCRRVRTGRRGGNDCPGLRTNRPQSRARKSARVQ